MSKKYYSYGFKVDTKEIKEDNRKRANKLKEKGTIKDIQEIFNIGLEVLERRDHETATINKRTDAIIRRDKAIDVLIETNAQIRACNIRLKEVNPKRHKDLDVNYMVLKLYTEDNKDFLKEMGGYTDQS